MKSWQLGLVMGLYFGIFIFLKWRLGIELIYWLVGGGLGVAYESIDRTISLYLFRDTTSHRLASRSGLFMLGWMPVAIYVVTSTGSLLAIAMVMSIGLRIITEVMAERRNFKALKARLFWQIKRPVSDWEVKIVLGVFALVFGGLTWAVFRI